MHIPISNQIWWITKGYCFSKFLICSALLPTHWLRLWGTPRCQWSTCVIQVRHDQETEHPSMVSLFVWGFFKDFIYLFCREGKGGSMRGRGTAMCGCLSCSPHWGPGLQPRHVPWLEIEPVTLWFTGQHSTTEPHQPWLFGFFIETPLATKI